MSVNVPPAIAAEIGSIAEAPEGEQLRILVARARPAGNPDEILTAELAGIAMNPVAYDRFDRRQETIFESVSRLNLPPSGALIPELVIGSGFHGATYTAVRHLVGYEKPYVVESGDLGGAFAVTRKPSFFLNSENTGGLPGAPWDDAANQLNWLPGAPVQCSHITGRELIDNTAMRFVIRSALMAHARVISGMKVNSIAPRPLGLRVDIGSRVFTAKRVIIATGVGPERSTGDDGKILSWSQAMRKMDGNFPFKGMKRVAVVGDGKSALCAAEALLGIGPDASMRSAADGLPVRVDLYSTKLPRFRQNWLKLVQSRYLRLGSHLATEKDEDNEGYIFPSGYGAFHDLEVRPERGYVPRLTPGGVLVNGRFYDCAVMCTGHDNGPELIDGSGLPYSPFSAAGRVIALKASGSEIYKVGPCADLAWEKADFVNQITSNPEQKVAMHRLAPLTAALAATLPMV